MPLTVADIMDAEPVTVYPEDTVEAVLRVLRENELPGVPVINWAAAASASSPRPTS